MGRFISDADVKTIHAPWWEEADEERDLPREEVVIRRYTVLQRDQMNREIFKITGTAGGLSEIQVDAALLPILKAGIKSWTLRKPDGKIAPCNEHWLEK